MVALGQIKDLKRQHRCLDFRTELTGHYFPGVLYNLSLRFVVVPNCRHVLSADPVPQRVVIIPEEFDNILKADHVRIKVNL